jgi:streptogramin lyase/tRNA A-37 threonylcarbamoyl transferase component Bud32
MVGGYRIDSLIGRGGMSVVYLAEDAHLGRRVALKFLPPDLAQDSQFRERFVRESRLAASLEHPNIVTVYDAREADGQLYLAMRYVAGTDLKRLIASDGPLDPERTISILSQAASALDAAHAEGLIHRDVKPGNILIAPRPDPASRDRVYLSDFGLTKRATSESGITATGQFVGTLDYAAPEQFEGKALDSRADVYSLGCVLYECLTGEVPHPRDNQAALVYAHLHAPPPKLTAKRPDLPPAIDDVLAKALAKAPDDRYDSAGELAEAAAEALGVETVAPTTPTGPVPLGAKRAPPNRRAWVLAVGAGVLAIVAVVIGLVVANRGSLTQGSPSVLPAAGVDYVARVDPSTRQVVAKIPVGKNSIDVAVGEGSVWVLDKDGSVRRIDPVTNTLAVIEGVAKDPKAIAAGEGAIWVADGASRAIHKNDPSANKVASSFPTEGFVFDVVAGEGAVWSAVRTEGLVRFDPASGESTVVEVDPAHFGQAQLNFAEEVHVAVGEGFVWLADDSGILVRLDPKTNHLDPLELDKAARDLAVYGHSLWVTSCGTPGTVSRYDDQTGRLVATISAGGAVCPYFVAGNRISVAAGEEGFWVTDGANGTVSRIREVTNQVDAPIRVGDRPTAVAVGLGSVWITVNGQESPSPSTS